MKPIPVSIRFQPYTVCNAQKGQAKYGVTIRIMDETESRVLCDFEIDEAEAGKLLTGHPTPGRGVYFNIKQEV